MSHLEWTTAFLGLLIIGVGYQINLALRKLDGIEKWLSEVHARLIAVEVASQDMAAEVRGLRSLRLAGEALSARLDYISSRVDAETGEIHSRIDYAQSGVEGVQERVIVLEKHQKERGR